MSTFKFQRPKKKYEISQSNDCFIPTSESCGLMHAFCISREDVEYTKMKHPRMQIITFESVFEDFAKLQLNNEGILAFLNKYGSLTKFDDDYYIENGGKALLNPIERKSEIIKAHSDFLQCVNSLQQLNDKKSASFQKDDIQKLAVEFAVKICPKIDCQISSINEKILVDVFDGKITFNEETRCHSLITFLYYGLKKKLLNRDKHIKLCNQCGYYFLASNSKKIEDKCSICIKQNRIKRSKTAQRDNPRRYYLEQLRSRCHKYKSYKSKYRKLVNWFGDVKLDFDEKNILNASDNEFDNWKSEIEKSWKKLKEGGT